MKPITWGASPKLGGTTDEVTGTARLVDAAVSQAEGGAPTATLARSEIEAALQDKDGADLVLEIARIQSGARDDRTVKVFWERSDLEELVRSSADQITLRFDEAELEHMLDTPDIEAHGLRERALVLTVAAATAAGMAGAAQAYPADSRAQPITPAAAQARNVQPSRLDAYPMGRALLAQEHATPTAGGGSSVPDRDVEAAVAGGLALLITGAAFVGRSQRRRERPA